MSDNLQASLLVTGASGQLGRQVVELLLEKGAQNVIATTRTPEKLADLAERGVTVRQASFDDLDSLIQAFEGAERVLIISTDATDVPGRRLQQHQNAVQAADKAGVKHTLYTSLMEAFESPVTFAPDHFNTERALQESSMGYTILRNNTYMDVLVPAIQQAYQLGGLYNASGDGKTAYITRADCGRAAAAALIDSFDGQRTLDVTGPEAVTQADIAATASSITGKPLSYVPVEVDAAIQSMVDAGLPRPVAETFASFDVATAQGKFANVTSVYKEFTGEEPTSLAQFLTAHKDELV
ncbi:SDR family oxidoreductase [Phototrophicus methaneseepsis]|uniref:SDR family oxidoreductase n=1 Tax=Phototrophicus methaneseepsis TaxID=2710758 RepID=A0A7S8ICJ8_9CHLR|nr:SDR family oxidoreductase [Phototrophicus methaneseepsis]QPC80607.1 SDR family oxidoreductase [Phototrophicus methaneseepsis]